MPLAFAVNENPYQSPCESTVSELVDPSIADRLLRLRVFRQKWSRRCWWMGGFSIIVGVSGFGLSQLIYLERGSNVLAVSIDVAAICLIVLGGALIVFGPISWFWFHRNT